jgi:MFS family permease
MFDGVEIGLFPLVARPALQELLADMGDAEVGRWNGIVVACFLLGAAMGGLVFGWLGDKIGRVRAMFFSILAYSLFTGAGYFATAAWHLAVFRFLASLGMGGEWAVAVALVVECWPERHRPKLAGAIGAAANFGFLFIGLVAYLFPVKADSWRWLMLVGAGPAVLALLVILFVPESERWKASKAREAAQPKGEVSEDRRGKRTALAAVLLGLLLVFAWIVAGEALVGSDFFTAWAAKVKAWDLTGVTALQHLMGGGLLVAGLLALIAGNLAARHPMRVGMFPGLVVLAVGFLLLQATVVWAVVCALFILGSMTGTQSVRTIFSPGLRGKTTLAIVFSAIPLIGTWAAVSGWIPLWVEQMKQARLIEERVPGADLTGIERSQVKAAIEEAKTKLSKAEWGQIGHEAARAKASAQIILAIGAILGCFIAPVIGGILGRRPVYFALCLLSLLSCAYLFRALVPQETLVFLLTVLFVGGVTAAFYGWLPLYLPELFPTRVRATGQGLSFNFGRILAAVGGIYMGELVMLLGGDYGEAMARITLVYVAGMVLIWLAPETKGKPLPE